MKKRRITKKIFVGKIPVGGTAPVSIQSMTNTDTRNVRQTISQIRQLARLGCEIIRVAVPDDESAAALKDIVKQSLIPVIADIHFDHKLAIKSIMNGADCIRINPGNIKNPHKLREIIYAAGERKIPIRIGVNAGSLDPKIKEQVHDKEHMQLVQSAIQYVKFFEDNGFYDMKISLKSANVITTIRAYEEFSRICDYPLHIGVTEAGTFRAGTIRSSIGIGYLLLNGIGDTIRVSLTASPQKEVLVAKEILNATGRRNLGAILISCPTCARREIDVIYLANKIESYIRNIKNPLKVAVMGCPVNGPGEAMEADIGLAGSQSGGLIFKKGKVIKRISGTKNILDEFIKEIEKMDKEQGRGK